MKESNEEKATKFLEYIAENEQELKKALKKNITYDEELFDDVFNETILKVYNSIAKNGTEIKDYKQYFFISGKWTYALRQNNYKKEKDRTIRDFGNIDISNEKEVEQKDRDEEMKEAFKSLCQILYNNFDKNDVDLFLTYYKKKSNHKYTLKQLQEDTGLRQIEINIKLKAIKDFINSNEEIKDIKKLI